MPWDKWLFVVSKDYHGYAHDVLTEGKKNLADEYRAKGYDVLTSAEFDDLQEKWERKQCGHWKEITEEQYDDALCVLPPLRWYDGGFFVGEAYSGSLYDFYQKLNGRFYTSLQSIHYKREDILASLDAFVKEEQNA